MPTLILSPRQTEDSRQLWRAAIQLGWGIERLAKWEVSKELRSVPEPVLYIEPLMIPMVSEAFGLRVDEPDETWLVDLPMEYRQRSITLSTLGRARAILSPAFVKPPNDKSFPARVYAGHELSQDFPDDTRVLIAEPVRWLKEFRCFILDRQVLAFSVYLRDGVLQRECGFVSSDDEDSEMLRFAASVLRDQRVQLPRAVVMDVGVIENRGWAVVELNSAWGAGIYGCNPADVLEVLRHSVGPI